MKSRGSSLASVKHFLHISPEGASTIPCKSQPILWNHMFLWTPESPWQFVVDIGIIHRGYPACTHTWGKTHFLLWGSIVHSETPAFAYIFIAKSQVGSWRWLFPAKFSHLYYKDGKTTLFSFYFSAPLSHLWIHRHTYLSVPFLSLKSFSISSFHLSFIHCPVRRIWKWSLILLLRSLWCRF